MRLDRLDLLAYGPFTDVAIDFGPAIGLHVVFGPNEAGKSSALRAVGDLLFGVPGQSSDNFLHPYDALRIRATISTRDGRRLEFVRRKGRSGTDLLGSSGRPLGRDALAPFLGGAERGFFERAFGLDPKRLADGATDLLRSGGDVGRAVLQASSGLSGLGLRLEALEAEAGQLFRERGKTQAINAALATLKALETELRSARLSGESWRSLEDELATVRREAKRLLDERVAADAEQHRLSRLQRARPLVARRASLRKTVEDLAPVPLLPAEFDAAARAAKDRLLEATAAADTLEDDIALLEQEVSGFPAAGPLLRHRATIEALHQDCGTMREFRRDLPKREGELREATLRATRLAAGIAPGMELDALLAATPTRPVRKALRARAAQQRALRADLAREESELAATRESVRLAETKLAALGPAIDPAPLARALREAARSGDPVERLDKVERLELKARTALEESLASLPGWTPPDAALLARLPFPGDAVVDAFHRRFGELEDAERELAAEKTRLTAERAKQESARRKLARGGALPSREAVAGARERRTKGWRLVRRIYVERDPGLEEEGRRFDPERPLVEAFERSVETADVAADRLVEASDDAARDAELARQLAQIEVDLDACARKGEDLAQKRQALEAEWSATWPPEGPAPGAPAAMKEWLRSRSRVLERLENHRNASTDRDDARSALDRAHASLRAAVALVQPDGPPLPDPFPEAEASVEANRQALEEKAIDRKRLETAIATGNERLASLTTSFARAAKGLEDWKSSWSEDVRAIWRSAEVSTDEVEAVLDDCDRLDSEAVVIDGLRDRVEKMRERLDAFGAAVASLCGEVAPDLAATDAVAAAATLFERLGAERSLDERRAATRESLEKSRGRLEKAQRQVAAARREVDAVCREAGCADVAALPARLEQLGEKRQAQKALGQVEGDLLDLAGGRSPEDLAAECVAANGDALPGLFEIAGRRKSDLDEEIGTLHRREGELKKSLEAADGGDSAAARGQEAAGVRARIEEDARRWLRLRASAWLLRRAVESWRKENQDPLLVEASRIFSSLTAGRFVSLLATVDKSGEPVVIAERAEGRRVPMEGLSDGTRDQLYLALRLASLHRYAREAEPLPFIADDLLVSFDDARAAAALETLSEFGKEVQVILFTHHRHIVDLANTCLSPGDFRLHELG